MELTSVLEWGTRTIGLLFQLRAARNQNRQSGKHSVGLIPITYCFCLYPGSWILHVSDGAGVEEYDIRPAQNTRDSRNE